MIENVPNFSKSRGDIMHGDPIIYSTLEMAQFSKIIADLLGYPLGEAVLPSFDDGEARVKLGLDNRGGDIFAIGSTHQPDRNLMELLCIIRAAKKASAERITAVMPYFGYCRADWKDKPRVCPTTKLVCDMLMAAGIDRLLTVDLHASQIMEFFDTDVCVDQLFGASYFLDVIALDWENSAIVALDQGSHKVCKRFWKVICRTLKDTNQNSQLPVLAFINKTRPEANKTETTYVINIEEGRSLKGREILLIDDMIDTAGSVEGSVIALRRKRVKSINVATTHGVLSGSAINRLKKLHLDNLWVTDTVPSAESKLQGIVQNYHKESITGLLAEAIKRIHEDHSISALIKI